MIGFAEMQKGGKMIIDKYFSDYKGCKIIIDKYFSDYEGCTNCKHQPEPLQMCEWGKKRNYVEPICSGWERRTDERFNQ